MYGTVQSDFANHLTVMMFFMLLWVYIHTEQAEKLACGNRTRDLWDTSPTLCQLSYEAKSVISDILQVLHFSPFKPLP